MSWYSERAAKKMKRFVERANLATGRMRWGEGGQWVGMPHPTYLKAGKVVFAPYLRRRAGYIADCSIDTFLGLAPHTGPLTHKTSRLCANQLLHGGIFLPFKVVVGNTSPMRLVRVQPRDQEIALFLMGQGTTHCRLHIFHSGDTQPTETLHQEIAKLLGCTNSRICY